MALWFDQKHLKSCQQPLEIFVKLTFLLLAWNACCVECHAPLMRVNLADVPSVITLTPKALWYWDKDKGQNRRCDETKDSRLFCGRGSFENWFSHLLLFSCNLSLLKKKREQPSNVFHTKSWLLVCHCLTWMSSGLQQYWGGQGIILSQRSIFKVLSEP